VAGLSGGARLVDDRLYFCELGHRVVELVLLHQNDALQHQLVNTDQLYLNGTRILGLSRRASLLMSLFIQDFQQLIDVLEG
jgi:hypothetical protein